MGAGQQQLLEKLRWSSQLAILVYEPDVDESPHLDHHVDMVITLRRRCIEQPLSYLIHELCIEKARYQEAALGWHQFKIRGSGIAVFPSLHFQVHHHNYMELELIRSRRVRPEKNPCGRTNEPPTPPSRGSLLDMICAPRAGESIVLLGARNSFKTELCLDFLAHGTWGCPRQNEDWVEKGLLISLIDNAPDIQHGLACPWKRRLKGEKCHGVGPGQCLDPVMTHARPYCQRPGCISPAEFFHYVSRRMDMFKRDKGIRVVFWDLTQLDYRFPLFRDDTMLLPALLDDFKTRRFKALFMGAGNASNTRAASAMADHVVFCWRTPPLEKEHASQTPFKGIGPALAVHVDRTSAHSQQAGKSLYRIPIGDDDKLIVPLKFEELEGYLYPLLQEGIKSLNEVDRDQIDRITKMQGVA